MSHSLLQMLPEITKKINRALTLEEVYQVTIERSLNFLQVTDGSIVLVNRATNYLQIKARMVKGQWHAEDSELNLQMLERVVQQVMRTGRPLNCPDTTKDPLLATLLQEDTPRSLLLVPISIDDRILGSINVESTKVAAFSLADEQFLTMLGELVALAIETQMLRSLSAGLSTLPVEKILPQIAEVACSLFAARSSAILLMDNRADEEIRGARFPLRNSGELLTPRINGLTHKVVTTCQPLIVRDVQNDPRVKSTTKERGIQTILGVPLKTTQNHNTTTEVKAIGALFVDILEDRAFSEREQTLLQSLANQAAIAIEKVRHTQVLHRLNQSYFEITSAQQDVFGVAETLMAQAAKLLNAKGGRLCLLDETGTEVQQAIMTSFPEPLKVRLEATIGVLGYVVRTKQPFAVSNYQSWPERRKRLDKYGFTAVAGAPIIYQDRLWGVILVHDTVEGRVFDQGDLDLLTSLGNLAAVAFSNASRLNDLERIMASASTAVIAVDVQGRITQFNRQAEEMLQYKKGEVLGKPITDIYYYEQDARRINRLMLESTEGSIREYTTHLRSKKGQKIPIKLSASLLFDYEGKRSGSVGFFQDERRNEARVAIASLLDQQEIFEFIVNQARKITDASHSAYVALNIDNKLQVTVTSQLDDDPKNQRLPIDMKHAKRIGISGRAFKTGLPQLVGDVTLDPDYINFDPRTRSELAVPIKTPEGVIGVIDVEHSDQDAFSETDRKNLETLAQFAAIAIHNSHLYAESQIDKQRFATIAEIIREAAQSTEIDQLLRNTSRRLETIFKEKRAVASIRLYDKVAGVLRFEPNWHESFHHRPDNKLGTVVTVQDINEGICGLVIKTRRAQNVGDVNQHAAYLRVISTTQSELAVPIHLDETQELIGVLDMQSPLLNAFTRSDVEYLELLARHLAIDIDKSKLAERERKETEAKHALIKIHETLIRPVGLQETLDQLTQQVYHLAQGRGMQINSVILRLVRGTSRILASAQPPEILLKLQKDLPTVEIAKGVDGKIGISGRAILSRKTQLIGDVSLDPDYLLINEVTQSELAVPIIVNDKVIAAMDIECADKDAFNEDDKQIFEALAGQAGIAIYEAYQHSALERRSRHQMAVYEASRIISKGISANQSELLNRILEQAVERIQLDDDRKANLGAIQLYNPDKKELRRESIYPREALKEWESKLGSTRLVDRTAGPRIGIMGRTILEQRAQRVDDVNLDPDYACIRAATRSELDVPLLDEDNNVLGVLGLESDRLAAFDEEDERALQNLADLAVIAIRNSQRYQELEETKAVLAARTAIAWLGADRSAWQHKIVGHIGALENYTKLIERDLEAGVPKQKLKERLAKIENLIAKTREKKIAQPLSPDEGLELVHVDSFIAQWLKKVYWDPELYERVPYQLRADADGAHIRIHAGWFTLVLDNVVNNAFRAMEESLVRKLTLKTTLVQDQVEITVTDTGKGIDPLLLPMLGRVIIKKENGTPGEGIGQMLSRMIVETYKGELKVLSTSPAGTSIAIRLPCECP